jgi:hypothetical protein
VRQAFWRVGFVDRMEQASTPANRICRHKPTLRREGGWTGASSASK